MTILASTLPQVLAMDKIYGHSSFLGLLSPRPHPLPDPSTAASMSTLSSLSTALSMSRPILKIRSSTGLGVCLCLPLVNLGKCIKDKITSKGPNEPALPPAQQPVAAMSCPDASAEPARTVQGDQVAIQDMILATGPPPLNTEWEETWKEQNKGSKATPGPKLPWSKQTKEMRQADIDKYANESLNRFTAMAAREPYKNVISDEHIDATPLHVPAEGERPAIKMTRFASKAKADAENSDPAHVLVYYHGGGLKIGDDLTEQVSIRCTAAKAQPEEGALVIYSVDYRLLVTEAHDSVADAKAAYKHVRALHPSAKMYLAGSSSGGMMATIVAQDVASQALATGRRSAIEAGLHGVALRCPVTADAQSGLEEYVPEEVRSQHVSGEGDRFVSPLLNKLVREVPRDGLTAMPLEVLARHKDVTRAQPRHFLQLCTNDTLYSDGQCYATLLVRSDVEVRADVIPGFPHTFWNLSPQMDRSYEAEEEFAAGVKWLLGGSARDTWL